MRKTPLPRRLRNDKIDNVESLIVTNYKEPLTETLNGHGYMGALRTTSDGLKLECHICGGLFTHLGRHVWMGHKITAEEYRVKFGLAKSTALVGEGLRRELSMRLLEQRNNRSDEENKAIEEKKRQNLKEYFSIQENRRNHFMGASLEQKNKHGKCPEQLKEKVVSLYNELGRTPSYSQFTDKYGKGFTYSIYQTFGGWKQLIKACGMPDRPSDRVYVKKYDKETLLEYLRNFKQLYGREPNTSDMKRGYIPRELHYYRVFGTFTKAKELAFNHEKETQTATVYNLRATQVHHLQ